MLNYQRVLISRALEQLKMCGPTSSDDFIEGIWSKRPWQLGREGYFFIGPVFSWFLLLCFSVFSAFSAFVLFLLLSFLLFRFLLFLLLCLPAFVLLCFSAFCFPDSLLFPLLRFLLFCFCAFLLLLFFSSVMCFYCSTSCSCASLLPFFTVSLFFYSLCRLLSLCFSFSFALFSPVCILNETQKRP